MVGFLHQEVRLFPVENLFHIEVLLEIEDWFDIDIEDWVDNTGD